MGTASVAGCITSGVYVHAFACPRVRAFLAGSSERASASTRERFDVVNPGGILDEPQFDVDREHAAIVRLVVGLNSLEALGDRKLERADLQCESDTPPPVSTFDRRQTRAQAIRLRRPPHGARPDEFIAVKRQEVAVR